MRIIAIEKEIGEPEPEAFAPHLKAETHRVLELQQQDILREIYSRADKHEAVLILECEGVEEARQVLDSLPLAKMDSLISRSSLSNPIPAFCALYRENRIKFIGLSD